MAAQTMRVRIDAAMGEEAGPFAPEPGDRAILEKSLLDTLTAKELGRMGEDIAASYLEERGMEIVERNYRCPEGEADLIAFDPETDEVVLVEVKTRRVRSLDDGVYPEEAVDAAKRRRYRRIAGCYLMDNFPVSALRFDVIALSFADGRTGHLEHVVDLFGWDGER